MSCVFSLLKKNLGCRLQLQPLASWLDSAGEELPPREDEWILDHVSSEGVQISNMRTSHSTVLRRDHIHRLTTLHVGARSGRRQGLLTLHVQLFLQGCAVWIRPNQQPGMRVKPRRHEFLNTLVDYEYPRYTGLDARLAASGYQSRWVNTVLAARLTAFEGYEFVVEPGPAGRLTRFHVSAQPTNLTLVKRRE